ncbi:unnamed protein product [Linum tenue]|uniref:Non-specific lipid-transfer protein n=3 Tax=Linum tenue TaxID=586396 RepID=A0AAV0RNI7_9ROSI|nr:unnamed protein product [Linum tenue]CAI0557994.1 unnamed protein product [Linum tenue]
MAATKIQFLVALMAVAMVASAQLAEGTVTCGQVTSSLAPCLGYLTGRGGVTPGCCNGIRSLNGAARSTPDRQQACRCLKNLAGSVRGVNMGNAAGLPGKCGVNVGFPISNSVDCSRFVSKVFY